MARWPLGDSAPDGTAVLATAGLGTFAEEMIVHEMQAVKVDSDLPSEQLALIGCGVTTGLGAALNTAHVQPGSSVAVIGCGGVGQAVVQGARIAGAARIFVVDPVELKRKAAAGFGATDLVDPAAGDPVAQIKEATGGRGADYAFEVIGLPETIHQAYNTARRGGTVVVVGMPNADATVTFSAFQLFLEEKRTLGCFYGFGAYRRRLISSGKRPSVAAVAVGHRAHRLAFAMLRSQEPYNPKRWAAAVADGSVMAKTGGRSTRTT